MSIRPDPSTQDFIPRPTSFKNEPATNNSHNSLGPNHYAKALQECPPSGTPKHTTTTNNPACSRVRDTMSYDRYHNSASGTGSWFVALVVAPRYKNVNPTNSSPLQDFATTPRGWPLEVTSSIGICAPPALLAKTVEAVHGILSSVRKLDFLHNPSLPRPKRHSNDNSIRS